jgi:hypothetical protein
MTFCRVVRQDRVTEHPEAGNVTPSNARRPAEGERLNDIMQKLRCWGYLSHFPAAEQDVAWLVEKLVERDERIAELEARLRSAEWTQRLP